MFLSSQPIVIRSRQSDGLIDSSELRMSLTIHNGSSLDDQMLERLNGPLSF